MRRKDGGERRDCPSFDTHILRFVPDTVVLARLRAVNRAMRDAVDQTGLSVDELPAEEAAELGCLETLKH